MGTVEEIVDIAARGAAQQGKVSLDIQEKYQGIMLNFGKYKGQTLQQIINDKKGSDYLKWLHSEFKKKETLTPTQKAILKYIKSVYDL
jgi:hypothetical protein